MAIIVIGKVSSREALMFLMSATILLAIVMLAMSVEQGKSSVVVCNSISCKYNRLCRCTRKNIVVYDNTVTGLCLYHTDSMKDRVLEPLKKSGLLEQYQHETYVADTLTKIEEDAKDNELLKNPNVFARWMRKHGIGKQANDSQDGENTG